MRPWFGKKADGRVVDLEDMTYAEAIGRMVELMYVKHQQRWIHRSHCRAVLEFTSRAVCRLAQEATDVGIAIEFDKAAPPDYASRLVEEYPAAATLLLASEDVQFFVALCKRRGQKPFPFIPVLDADFGVFLQKDTIWQSEDLDSVVDGDPQRVAIQQGPVAARYSTVANEPVKDILDGIYHSHIAALVERQHGGDESSIPVIEYVGPEPAPAALPAEVRSQVSASGCVYWLPSQEDRLPGLEVWLLVLAGPRKSWLHALVAAPVIAQGDRYVDNYARRLLRPRPGCKVTVNCAGGLPASIKIADSAGNLELEVGYNADRMIRLTVHHTTANGDCVPVSLAFAYAPAQALAPIHESRQGNGASLMQGYIGICVPITSGCTELADIVDTAEVAHSALTITKDHSRALCRTVGNRSWQYVRARGGRVQAPMEFLHIAAFSSILRILLSPVFGPNPTNVIHLYNKTMLNDGVVGLHVGDSIAAAVRVCRLENVALGKQLTLMITLCRAGQAIATIEMALLGRSDHVDVHKTIRRHSGQTITIALATAADVALLEAKEWFLYREDASVAITPGMDIEFCLDSEYRFVKEGVYSSISTTGTVTVRAR
ncbi:fatty acid synthase alpha subunit Lsd1, partial [Coemansia biformis]